MGNTQNNEIDLLYSIDPKGTNAYQVEPVFSIARAFAHELGHSAGLEHPWKIIDIRQEDINQNSEDITYKKVAKNLMNSFENKDNPSDNGTEITDGQKNVVEQTVKKQEVKP